MEIPVIDEISLAPRIHDLVNRRQQEQGLTIFGTETALAYLARAHSKDMAANGYFSQVNLQERAPNARGAAAGYTCRRDYGPNSTYEIAKNIFATYRYDSVQFIGSSATEYGCKTDEDIAQETVDAWMNITDPRDNILDMRIVQEGIGVAIGTSVLIFVTEDLC